MDFTLLEGGQKHGTSCIGMITASWKMNIMVRVSCISDDPISPSSTGEIWSSRSTNQINEITGASVSSAASTLSNESTTDPMKALINQARGRK